MNQYSYLKPKTLYCDGGGTPTSRCYFSYKCIEDKYLKIERFYLDNLAPELLPDNCSIVDDRGLGTNNIAEYASNFFAIQAFRNKYGDDPVIIFQDSQLVVNQVNRIWQCKKPHLRKWRDAILKIKHSGVSLEWVRREKIVPILGH